MLVEINSTKKVVLPYYKSRKASVPTGPTKKPEASKNGRCGATQNSREKKPNSLREKTFVFVDPMLIYGTIIRAFFSQD